MIRIIIDKISTTTQIFKRKVQDPIKVVSYNNRLKSKLFLVLKEREMVTDPIAIDREIQRHNYKFEAYYHTGQKTTHYDIDDLKNFLEFHKFAIGVEIYIILPSYYFSFKSIKVPGKLDKKVLKSLLYQVESELISSPENLHLEILESQGSQIHFAICEKEIINRLKTFLLDTPIVVKACYPEPLLINHSAEPIVWYFDGSPSIHMCINNKFFSIPIDVLEHMKEYIQSELHKYTNDHQKNEEFELLCNVYADNITLAEKYENVKELTKVIEESGAKVVIKEVEYGEMILKSYDYKPFHFFKDLLKIKENQNKLLGILNFLKYPFILCSLISIVFFLQSIFYIKEQNKLLLTKENEIIHRFNQETGLNLNSVSQIKTSISQIKKQSSALGNNTNLFDWYKHFPKLFEEQNDIQVIRLSYDSSKSQLALDMIIKNYETLNNFKEVATNYFTIIEQPAIQKLDKIEIKLILKLPKE